MSQGRGGGERSERKEPKNVTYYLYGQLFGSSLNISLENLNQKCMTEIDLKSKIFITALFCIDFYLSSHFFQLAT